MPPLGLEPTVSAGERPQTHALDRTTTGVGQLCFVVYLGIDVDLVAVSVLAESLCTEINKKGNFMD